MKFKTDGFKEQQRMYAANILPVILSARVKIFSFSSNVFQVNNWLWGERLQTQEKINVLKNNLNIILLATVNTKGFQRSLRTDKFAFFIK